MIKVKAEPELCDECFSFSRIFKMKEEPEFCTDCSSDYNNLFANAEPNAKVEEENRQNNEEGLLYLLSAKKKLKTILFNWNSLNRPLSQSEDIHNTSMTIGFLNLINEDIKECKKTLTKPNKTKILPERTKGLKERTIQKKTRKREKQEKTDSIKRMIKRLDTKVENLFEKKEDALKECHTVGDFLAYVYTDEYENAKRKLKELLGYTDEGVNKFLSNIINT